MVGNAVLLILKQIWVPRMNTGLYSFQTEWFRGFQSGDPARVNVVIIEAFDRQDREVELWIGSEKQANNKPSQEDINRVLYSLHPI